MTQILTSVSSEEQKPDPERRGNGRATGSGRKARRKQECGQGLLAPEPEVLAQALEGLLLVASEPAAIGTLAKALGVRPAAIDAAAETLSEALRGRGIRLQRCGERLQLVSAPAWARYVERFLGVESEQPLSTAALETLAIVAYRQPITRAGVEIIRGVGAERAIATLRSRGLIEETGRAEGVGRPLLYGTTMLFLEHFGLEGIHELPPLPTGETP